MLPGFRFLFAAIVFSMSLLVFGLGAAALLRAAHEQFASNPAWHAAPEATFTQQADVSRPVLAMLRVEPEQRASDAGPSPGIPGPAVPEAEVAPEAARPEPAPESTQQTDAPPAQADATAAADAETKLASIEPASPQQPANDVTAVTAGPASEPPAAPAAVETNPAATKIATLGGPPVAVETPPPAKAAVDAKPDRGTIRRHQRARRAAQRRRLAARARLAAQQVLPAADPFAPNYNQPQPTAKPAAAARTR